jgi:hypothetical protein
MLKWDQRLAPLSAVAAGRRIVVEVTCLSNSGRFMK